MNNSQSIEADKWNFTNLSLRFDLSSDDKLLFSFLASASFWKLSC